MLLEICDTLDYTWGIALSVFSYAAGAWALLVVISLLRSWILAPGLKYHGKHVLITGGSMGLGLSLASKLAKIGAKVTILARNQTTLNAAVETIKATKPEFEPIAVSCDVTDYEGVVAAVAKANQLQGQSASLVICNAGSSIPGYFLDTPLSVHRKQMDLNYFGVLHVVKAVLPAMLEAKSGTVVLVSSAIAFIGMVGYTSYAPSKFALRGLCDSLRNEFAGRGVRFVGVFPSSIDSPGFLEENKTKPIETREIEALGEVFKPDAVADHVLKGIASGHYSITDEPAAELGRMGTNAVCPRNNLLIEIALLPLAAIVGYFYLLYVDYVVKKHAKTKRN